jgi:hypothetical protein
MPDSQNKISQNADAPAFIGLQSYSEAQSKFFFGRDEEINSLTTFVKSNTLTIVFGKSGTGKTSLLNAGVFPKLRKDYCLPFRIRLEFKEDSPDLITQIKNVLKTEIDKYGFEVKSYPSSETLWEYFHKEPLWKSVTPILVFDQFEEIFTLAKSNPRFGKTELVDFWEELSNLIENQIPASLNDQFINRREEITYNFKRQPVKVIFAFREEFLPEFESIPSNIPSLKYSRFRLLPMNEDQAYEVITKSWGNKIDDSRAKKIITYLTNDENPNSISEIEPSLLSQVCLYIDKERISDGRDKISAEFLAKYPKETILRSIYDEALSESNDAVKIADPGINKNAKPVNEFVENNLITANDGYRTKYSLKEDDAKLKPGIAVLINKYFIRDDGKSLELTHDVLTPLIKDDREKRRKANAIKKIFLWFLLGTIGIAAIIFFSITHEANQRKNEIVNEIADSLQSLSRIKNSIKIEKGNLDYYRSHHPESDTTGNTPISKKDSLRFDSIKNINEALNKQILRIKDSIAFINQKIGELSGDLESARMNIKVLDTVIDNLKGQITIDENKLEAKEKEFDVLKSAFDAKKKEYDDLVDKYLEYKKNHPDISPLPPVISCDSVQADRNRVKLILKYEFPENATIGKKAAIPPNLTIYLIPDIAENKKIIKKASVYEIRCDEMGLKNAIHSQSAQYCGGVYSFYNVAPGKYFIKICAYYGDFQTYTKRVDGIDSVKLELSPPIR